MTKQLPGMPPENQYEGTPLGDAMEEFASKKLKVAKAKLEMAEAEKQIIDEMKKKTMKLAKVTVDGENFEFEIIDGVTHVRCAQITKQPRKTTKKKLED